LDSISISNGGTLQASTDVNIIIGNDGLTITGGTISLKGGAASTSPPGTVAGDINHVLMYTRSTHVSITGNPTFSYSGPLFFAKADVKMVGNSGANTHCTEVVAKTLKISGNNTFDVDACPASVVPVFQYVRLVS